jgi:hypothetical protein
MTAEVVRALRIRAPSKLHSSTRSVQNQDLEQLVRVR